MNKYLNENRGRLILFFKKLSVISSDSPHAFTAILLFLFVGVLFFKNQVGADFQTIFMLLSPAVVAFLTGLVAVLAHNSKRGMADHLPFSFHRNGCNQIYKSKLTRIPILRSFHRVFLEDGAYHLFFLFFCFACGLLARILTLDEMSSITDENSHILEAYRIIKGDPSHYSRAGFVTYSIASLFSLFNPTSFREYLFLGRIPSAIWGALTVFPIYFLARRLSSSVASVSVFLWIVCPWAIGISRYIREYAIYPFFVVLAVIAILSAYENIRGKNILSAGFIVPLLYIVFLLTYSIVFDKSSTLKVCAVVIIVSVYYILLLSLSNFLKSKTRYFKILVFAFVCFSFAVAVPVFQVVIGKLGLTYELQIRFLFTYFPSFGMKQSTVSLWWNKNEILYCFSYFIILCGMISISTRARTMYTLILLITVALLTFYMTFFSRYFRPRYSIYILPFFTILVACGVDYLLFRFPKVFAFGIGRILATLSVLLFLAVVFDYQNTVDAITCRLSDKRGVRSPKSGHYVVTDEYHQDYQGMISYLRKKISPDDVFIISYLYYPALIIDLKIDDDKIHRIAFKSGILEKSKEKVNELISQKKKGWVIVDRRRHIGQGKGYFSLKDAMYFGNNRLIFMKEINNTQIFRWEDAYQ